MSRDCCASIEIAGAIEVHDLVVGAQIFIGVSHIGHHLAARELLLLLGLRDGKAGARDFALVAIEERQLHLAEEGDVVQVTEVGVINLAGEIRLPLAFCSSYWLFAAVTPNCAACRSGLSFSAFA